jgi:hypothetical protein
MNFSSFGGGGGGGGETFSVESLGGSIEANVTLPSSGDSGPAAAGCELEVGCPSLLSSAGGWECSDPSFISFYGHVRLQRYTPRLARSLRLSPHLERRPLHLRRPKTWKGDAVWGSSLLLLTSCESKVEFSA